MIIRGAMPSANGKSGLQSSRFCNCSDWRSTAIADNFRRTKGSLLNRRRSLSTSMIPRAPSVSSCVGAAG